MKFFGSLQGLRESIRCLGMRKGSPRSSGPIEGSSVNVKAMETLLRSRFRLKSYEGESRWRREEFGLVKIIWFWVVPGLAM